MRPAEPAVSVRRSPHSWLAPALVALALLLPSAATAEPPADEKDPAGSGDEKDPSGDEKAPSGDEKLEATEAADKGLPKHLDPFENEGDEYVFVGLRFRNMVLPGAFLRLFTDGGPDVVNIFSFGPELTHRQGTLNLHLAVSYVDFSMDPTIIRGLEDDEDDFERVSSDLKAILFTLDILTDVYREETGRFAVSLGGSLGFGFVFDSLYQNQVYPNDPAGYDTGDPSTFTNCRGPNDPPVEASSGRWCDDGDDHYGDFDQPSWANGGSLPIIVPWAALPQISMRYKPIKQLQMRLDLGLSLYGPFFGLSAGYGF